jgi:hypothetical protein
MPAVLMKSLIGGTAFHVTYRHVGATNAQIARIRGPLRPARGRLANFN